MSEFLCDSKDSIFVFEATFVKVEVSQQLNRVNEEYQFEVETESSFRFFRAWGKDIEIEEEDNSKGDGSDC